MVDVTYKRGEWLTVLESLEDEGRRAEMGYVAIRVCRFYLDRRNDGAKRCTISLPKRIASTIDRIFDESYRFPHR